MRYILRTAGRMAKKFYRWAKEIGHECLSFADGDHSLWGGYIECIPVESPMRAFQRYRSQGDVKIVIAVNASVKAIREMCRELVGMGFEASDVLIVGVDFIRGDVIFPTLIPYPNYDALEYLEFHVTHRCNLNCAGCSHFVPVIPKHVEVDGSQLKQDLYRLKELVGHIENIRIMGGEPLLCPQLAKYCSLVRSLYPYANIKIVSNGILAMRMSDALIATIRANDVSMDITCYPPFFDKYDETAKWLNQCGISYHMDIRWGMCPVLHKDSEHKFRHDNTSLICECYNLFNRHLYPCPPTAYIHFFNEFFDESFPSDEGIDIYRCKSFEELWGNVISKKKMCDYCDHYFMLRNYERRQFSMSKQPPNKADYIRDYIET